MDKPDQDPTMNSELAGAFGPTDGLNRLWLRDSQMWGPAPMKRADLVVVLRPDVDRGLRMFFARSGLAKNGRWAGFRGFYISEWCRLRGGLGRGKVIVRRTGVHTDGRATVLLERCEVSRPRPCTVRIERATFC